MKRDFKLIQLELYLFCLNLLCDLVSENMIFTDFYKLELIAVFVVVDELSILCFFFFLGPFNCTILPDYYANCHGVK